MKFYRVFIGIFVFSEHKNEIMNLIWFMLKKFLFVDQRNRPHSYVFTPPWRRVLTCVKRAKPRPCVARPSPAPVSMVSPKIADRL